MSKSEKLAENPFCNFYTSNDNVSSGIEFDKKGSFVGQQGGLNTDHDVQHILYSDNDHVYESLDTSTPLTSSVYPSNKRLEFQRLESDIMESEQQVDLRVKNSKHFKRNDWPICFPIIRFNIKEDIPFEHRFKITFTYGLWIVLIITLILNLIGCIMMYMGGDLENIWVNVVISCVYLVFVTIASFLLWFRPLYNAFSTGYATYYVMFFFFGFWHIVLLLFAFCGVYGSGFMGILNAKWLLEITVIPPGTVGCVTSGLFLFQVIGLLYIYCRVFIHYKSQGLKFANARNEVATKGLKAFLTRNSNV